MGWDNFHLKVIIGHIRFQPSIIESMAAYKLRWYMSVQTTIAWETQKLTSREFWRWNNYEVVYMEFFSITVFAKYARLPENSRQTYLVKCQKMIFEFYVENIHNAWHLSYKWKAVCFVNASSINHLVAKGVHSLRSLAYGNIPMRHTLITLPEKIWNTWKAQWKHWYSIFWFVWNDLVPTTN